MKMLEYTLSTIYRVLSKTEIWKILKQSKLNLISGPIVTKCLIDPKMLLN